MKSALLFLCFGIAFVGFMSVESFAIQQDTKGKSKLHGTWRVTSGFNQFGGKLTDEQVERLAIVMTFKEGKYTIEAMGRPFGSGKYSADESKNPATIDMTIESDKNPSDKGKTKLGIFQIENESVKLAIRNPSGIGRPKDFVSDRETEVFILKRK